MSILMGGLSPHPPLIIPTIGGDSRNKIKKTINSLKELAAEIKEKKPDLLITISPHGQVFTDAISILDLAELAGDFADFGFPDISYKVKTEPEFVARLKQKAAVSGIEVLDLSVDQIDKYNFSAKLDHGVMVPLHFLQKANLKVPVVPITMGLMDYQKLFEFGFTIQQTLAELDLKGIIIASGDLSHRLKPGAPAGFNPRGQEFDDLLIQLLRQRDFTGIMNIDPHLIEKAGECGLRPLIIMLGSFKNLEIETEVKSYEGPFGVGYAVVGFYLK